MKDGRLRIVTKLQPWPEYLAYRRAGVNSFGYGGANAHVILDAAECYMQSIGCNIPKSWTSLHRSHQIPFRRTDSQLETGNGFVNGSGEAKHNDFELLAVSSAHDEASLDRFNMAILQAVDPSNARDVCFTLAKRSPLHHRAFTILHGDAPGSWSKGHSKPTAPTLAFIFTGQGAQWPRMGADLISRFPVVRKTFQRMQTAMDKINDGPDWNLVEALSEPPETSSMMSSITTSVTLCTAVQVAIVDLLKSWNVHGRVVLGHSSGEAAAAYAAGFLTAEEAVITSYYRALAMVRKAEAGAMLAVGLSLEEAHAYLDDRKDLYVACCNSPRSITISGKNYEIAALEKDISAAGKFARIIKSSGYGNHSPLVENAARYFHSQFKHSLPTTSNMARRQGRAIMYSCITGGEVTAGDLGIEYWSHNISRPVLFDQAAQSLFHSHPEIDHIIEIGPHSALAGPLREIKQALHLKDEQLYYVPSLIRGKSGPSSMMRLAGALFINGYGIDLNAANSPISETAPKSNPRLIVDLPGYAWAHDTLYWTQDQTSNEVNFRDHPRHDLLGSRVSHSSTTAPLWRNKLRLMDVPWIADHQIGQDILFPASCYLAIAIEGARQMAVESGHIPLSFTLEDVSITRPLVLRSHSEYEMMLQLVALGGASQLGDQSFRFEIFNEKVIHAHGNIKCNVGSSSKC